jgi:hypothetical protein
MRIASIILALVVVLCASEAGADGIITFNPDYTFEIRGQYFGFRDMQVGGEPDCNLICLGSVGQHSVPFTATQGVIGVYCILAMLLVAPVVLTVWWKKRETKGRSEHNAGMRFSLSTLLLCVTILAVDTAACSRLPIAECRVLIVEEIDRTTQVASSSEIHDPTGEYRKPSIAESAMRLAWSGPIAIAATLTAIWVVKTSRSRQKSRRSN